MDAETKQGFEAMAQALAAMEARIMKRFDQFDERIHDTETKLLSAFYGGFRMDPKKDKGSKG